MTKKQTPKKAPGPIKKRINGYVLAGKTNANRYLAARPHRSFRVTPPERYKKGKKVASVPSLVLGTFVTIWREKKYLLTLTLIFAFVTFLVVGGVSQLDFSELRKATSDVFSGNLGAFGTVTSLFTAAVTGGLNPQASVLQQFLWGFLAFFFWLSAVWILRRRLNDQPTSVREAIYNSGGPIIPSVLVALVVVIQLIPAVFAITAAALALTGVWFQGGVESMLICGAAILMSLLSFYWIAASTMALVVVSLPGMYPWKAISIASDLVIGQRWKIATRIVALLVTLLLTWALVLLPLLLLDSWLRFDWLPLIPIAMQLLAALSLAYASTYIFKMYKSMI